VIKYYLISLSLPLNSMLLNYNPLSYKSLGLNKVRYNVKDILNVAKWDSKLTSSDLYIYIYIYIYIYMPASFFIENNLFYQFFIKNIWYSVRDWNRIARLMRQGNLKIYFKIQLGLRTVTRKHCWKFLQWQRIESTMQEFTDLLSITFLSLSDVKWK
jgi:hypothetical protein